MSFYKGPLIPLGRQRLDSVFVVAISLGLPANTYEAHHRASKAVTLVA